MSPKIMIVVGEASADLHGASLVWQLKKLASEIEVYGVGGEHLKQAGAKIWFDFSRLGVVGFWEVIPKLRFFLKVREQLFQSIKTEKPDLVLLMDLPDFNLSLAKKIKQNYPRQKIVYYISPQVWAWRKGRIKLIKKYIDQMLVILPFEEDFYKRAGVPVKFVGHPLLERVMPSKSREEFRKEFGVKDEEILIAFLPGSRKEELKLYMPPSLSALAKLQMEFPIRAIMALAPTLKESFAQHFLRFSRAKLEIISQRTYDLLFSADLGLIGSGTATLEAGLAELPMIILARSSTINYWLARFLVDVPFFGLPNLIAEREICPELFMYEVNPEKIYQMLKALIVSSEERLEQKIALKELRKRLGEKKASQECAQVILELLRD